MRMKQPVRAKKPVHTKGVPRFTRALGTPAMIALVFTVLSVAILLAVSRPAPATGSAALSVAGERSPERDALSRTSTQNKAASSIAPAGGPATMTARGADATTANRPEVESAATTSMTKAAPVTITGCLESDDETFKLKNAIGQDAPKARSWKSGFLKKGAASIDVVDASKRLKLPAHVGERVSVTGMLVGREMQVRSLQRLAASCNQRS